MVVGQLCWDSVFPILLRHFNGNNKHTAVITSNFSPTRLIIFCNRHIPTKPIDSSLFFPARSTKPLFEVWQLPYKWSQISLMCGAPLLLFLCEIFLKGWKWDEYEFCITCLLKTGFCNSPWYVSVTSVCSLLLQSEDRFIVEEEMGWANGDNKNRKI